MEIYCTQHKLPLEIEERTIKLLDGLDYLVTIGRCPKCHDLYINRAFSPFCNILRVGSQSYRYHEQLHSMYPPKEPLAPKSVAKTETAEPTSKNVQTSSKSQNNQEQRKKGTQKKRKQSNSNKQKKASKGTNKSRIRSTGKPANAKTSENHYMENVQFVDIVPMKCPNDGNLLAPVKHASFSIDKAKITTYAHCCIKCNTAFLPKEKLALIEKKISEQKAKTLSLANTKASKPINQKLTLDYELQQIPVLTERYGQCPFGGNQFEGVVKIKYCSYGNDGQASTRYANLNVCHRCQAVFANTQIMQDISNWNKGRTVYTLSVADFSNAADMMKATKHPPKKNLRMDVPLPHEGETWKENISRNNVIVQVYANKCHCKKCENKYQRKTTVNRTAVIEIIDGSSVELNLMFCQGCGQYFINIIILEHYKSIGRELLLECRIPFDLASKQYYGWDFNPDSVLSRCGYNVRAGTSKEQRQAILRYVLESKKATKYEIIEMITGFIKLHKRQHADACVRWEEDMIYVSNYMIHRQEKVYNPKFVPAGSLKRK